MASPDERPAPATDGLTAVHTMGRGPLWRLGRYVALVRVRQWVKNGFVLMPILLTPGTLTAPTVGKALLAFCCFCAVSSASYIVNDYVDRGVDRQHPEKQFRPLAAGDLAVSEAAMLLALLLALAFSIASLLSATLVVIIAAYFILNLAYSFSLKHIAIVDIIVISAGFVLRVEAGAEAISVEPSVWIIVCTGLLALFLALGKRRDDLARALDGNHRRSLDGYNKSFVDVSLTIVLAATFVSYVIYTTDVEVMQRFGTERLYLTIPFVLAGILRYLQITLVEERSGSPTAIVLRDRFTILTVLGWLACLVVLIHF